MKAIGILPGRPHSARLVDLPWPQLSDVEDRCGVLVRVEQMGVDGTDRELYLGRQGAAPP